MEQIAPLGINLGYLVSQIVNFLLLYLLLRVALFNPMLKMLEKRKERIAEGLNKERQAQEALASAEADKQAILDTARKEAQGIVTEAQKRAEDVERQIKASAEEDAGRIRQQAQAEAVTIREQALADMRDQIINLSMAAAHNLIGESLDAKKQKDVVTSFFTDVPEGASALTGNVSVITAVPLTSEEQKKFTAALKSASNVSFKVQPGILGGVVLRAGSQEIDSSFAAQLATMQASLN